MTDLYITYIRWVAVYSLAPHRFRVVADAHGADGGTRDVEQSVRYRAPLEVSAVLLETRCNKTTHC